MRTALVSGAAQGIGLATVKALLAQGRRVLAFDLKPVPVLEGVRSARLDVTDTDGIRAFIAAQADWGPVQVLVNNAGISPKKPDGQSAGILEISREEFARVIEVNLHAQLRITQLVLPGMAESGWGRIVNLSSLAGRAKSLVAGGSYMAAKAGLIGLTRAVASEFGPRGVTCNAVAPGRILTEMAMQAGPAVNERYAAQIPVRRLGTPEEVAAAIAFLAGEDAGFVNGALLDVNGGFVMP